jgi:hypothetical protein
VVVFSGISPAAAHAHVGRDDELGSRRRGCDRAGTPPLKPPNTTECTAPMRAQASMAATVSGTIGM